MTIYDLDRRIDVSSISLQALSSVDCDVLLDFDHTLLSANSTNLFLESAIPRPLVSILVFGIRRIVPWKVITGSRSSRLADHLSCLLVIILTPWNLFLWRTIASDVFRRYESRDVSSMIRELPSPRLTIVTFGNGLVVRAMLKKSRWSSVPVIATPLFASLRFFSRGKASLVQKHISPDRVKDAIFITDSTEDSDLLNAVRVGLLIEPQGELGSKEKTYIPLFYTFKVKYPKAFFLDQTLFVDMLIPILATASNATGLQWGVVCLPFFAVSFLCVYEIGYFENDVVAALSELKPTLGDNISNFRDYPIVPSAWVWATGFAGIGFLIGTSIGLIALSSVLIRAVAWGTLLVVTRLLFRRYNLVPPEERLALYPLLQVLKYTSVLIIISSTFPGSILILSQVFSMSIIYWSYRVGGDRTKLDKEVLRCFIFFSSLVVLALEPSREMNGRWFSVLITSSYVLARLLKPLTRAKFPRRRAKSDVQV